MLTVQENTGNTIRTASLRSKDVLKTMCGRGGGSSFIPTEPLKASAHTKTEEERTRDTIPQGRCRRREKWNRNARWEPGKFMRRTEGFQGIIVRSTTRTESWPRRSPRWWEGAASRKW